MHGKVGGSTTNRPVHKPSTAVQKIELSQLNKRKVQRELMGDDIDLQDLVVYLKRTIQFDTADRITDVTITRDIEEASTVKITVNDYDRSVLHSRRLHNSLDIQIDGLWFRLVKVERTAGSDDLDLTFEQREIAILRTYPKPHTPHNGVIFADRATTTRAEFILRLIREVKEFHIPVVIPELHKLQEIEDPSDAPQWGIGADSQAATAPGIPTDFNSKTLSDQNASPQRFASNSLTVKGQPASKAQISNANTICAVGQSMGASPKVICVALMVATQESVLNNIKGGDNAHGGGFNDSAGLFQQIGAWGSYKDRTTPSTAARLFYKSAIPKAKAHPTLTMSQLCSEIQRDYTWNTPRQGADYAQWQAEADRWVSAYGIPISSSPSGTNEGTAAGFNLMGDPSTEGSDYLYFRGTSTENDKVWKREDSWTCIQRLALEVQWRAFFVSGVFYFMSDDDLFTTQPIAVFDETSKGIEGVGFDLDIGKKLSEMTIEARIGTWLAPPGAVIVAKNFGPASGRWIVHNFSRSLFDGQPAEITANKPLAELPEPLDDNIQTPPSWAHVNTAVDPTGIVADASPNAISQVALKAYNEEQKHHYHYLQTRPYPQSLWSFEAHNGIDCSSFATLVYKEAGMPDPNGAGYNGSGYTGTLVKHGRPVASPQPGDLIFYGGTVVVPGHVGVYVGTGKVVEIGSDAGIQFIQWDYRPVIAIRRYIGTNAPL